MELSTWLERVAIRTREATVTRSAWRLRIADGRGSGAILRVDADGESIYRGEGAFLGWTQDRLAAEYGRLLPKGDTPEPDPGQYG